MAAARGTGKEAAGEREHQAVQAGTRAARRARGRAAGTAPGGTVQGARPVRVDLRGHRAAARRPVERQTMTQDGVPLYLGIPLVMLCIAVTAVAVVLGITIWRDR